MKHKGNDNEKKRHKQKKENMKNEKKHPLHLDRLGSGALHKAQDFYAAVGGI